MPGEDSALDMQKFLSQSAVSNSSKLYSCINNIKLNKYFKAAPNIYFYFFLSMI